jgi:hypothetical protein
MSNFRSKTTNAIDAKSYRKTATASYELLVMIKVLGKK